MKEPRNAQVYSLLSVEMDRRAIHAAEATWIARPSLDIQASYHISSISRATMRSLCVPRFRAMIHLYARSQTKVSPLPPGYLGPNIHTLSLFESPSTIF